MNIISAIKKYKMLNPGDRVLVAVSGGPDSVALLHALHVASAELGIFLHIAHLNHGIRGEQSDLDEVFVRELAREFGIDATFERVDVPAIRDALHLGTEEAARIVRYEFLRSTAEKIGASKIAVGHNADDRAESVLLNIIRGAGTDGLGSIRPVVGNIIRPLIDTSRREIELYIQENALPYRIDESNMDIVYSRNRIRHELLPLLERDYNPQIKSGLVRLAEIAAMESDFVEQSAELAIEKIKYRDGLDVGLFIELAPALQYKIIRNEIKRLKGDLKDVAFDQVQRVVEALHEDADFAITLPSGVIYAIRKGNEFRICNKEEPAIVAQFDYLLSIPGITQIPEADIAIKAEVITNAKPAKLPQNEVIIDADAIKGTLRVRNIIPGDRITPFGMHGSKKLQDIFVDRKIPKRDRAKIALVVDDEKILWVIGVISSEASRITDCAKAIHLSVTAKGAT